MTYEELLEKNNIQSKYPIMLVKNKDNNKIHELSDQITNDSFDNLELITVKDKTGYDAYVRSVTFLLIKSFYKIVGKNNIDYLKVLFSLGDSLYIETKGNFNLNQELLETVKNKMKEIVDKNIPITKKIISKEKAIKLFNEYKMFEKAKLFHYRRVSNVTLYSLGHFDDYFYGDLASSTKNLGVFNLKKFKDGFLLLLPNINTPFEVSKVPNLDNLYDCLKESTEWCEKLGISTVGDLNNKIVDKTIDDVILLQESMMERKIGEIAANIHNNRNIKFVMIAGPSSSGKTSFAHRLSIQLKSLGLVPHPISVDDYFINRCDIKPDKDGNVDLESIDIVDTELFNNDMANLLKGNKVEIPRYNFVLGKREYHGDFLQLGENDILVIEGIHCLNDKMSYSLNSDNKYRIYISALTPLNIDEHNRVPSSDLRLIRRISRDARTRGTNPNETIKAWSSVRAGEIKNIFPFQENADVIFNSSLIYELLILKEIAEPHLFGISVDDDGYNEAKRLLKFFDFFLSYNDKSIPVNSIVREFIGGSYFNV